MLRIGPSNQLRTIAAVTAICLFGDAMLYVVLPIHWEQLGLDALWQVGVLLATNRMIRIPIHPLVGWFYERYSYNTGIMIAVVLAGITTASYGLLHSFWLLFLMRCLWGIAWALFKQAGQLAVVDALQGEPAASGKLSGTYNGIIGIGGLVGMLGGGILVQHVSVELIAIAFGLCAFCSLILVRRITSNIPSLVQDHAPPRVRARDMLNPGLKVLLLKNFIIACVFMGIFKSSLSYWIDQLNLENTTVTNLIGAAGLAGLIQALRMIAEPFLAPWIGNYSDRSGNRRILLTWSLIISIPLFSLIMVSIPMGLWITVVFGLLLLSIMVTTLMDAEASEQASRSDKHHFVSRYLMSSDIGAAVGPLIGFIIASFMSDIYLIVFTIFLLACAVGLSIKRQALKRGSDLPIIEINNVKG